MHISDKYLIYWLFEAFKIRPRTPSDPREVYITLLQQIPEIAYIFSVGIMKQSEWHLDKFYIFWQLEKLLSLIAVGKQI